MNRSACRKLIEELTNIADQSQSVYNLRRALRQAVSVIVAQRDELDRQQPQQVRNTREEDLLAEVSGKLSELINLQYGPF